MSVNFDDLKVYLENLDNFKFPLFEEIPDGIKMEGVIEYLSSLLSEFNNQNDPNITNYMINNYVKAKVISAPVEKTYTREQIAYLIFISFVKSVAPLRNMASLISIDIDYMRKTSELYAFYKDVEERTLKEVIRKSKEILEKKRENEEENNEFLKYADTAFRFYIDASVKKAIADSIMKEINESILPSKTLKEEKKEKIYEKKILDEEAKVLSKR